MGLRYHEVPHWSTGILPDAFDEQRQLATMLLYQRAKLVLGTAIVPRNGRPLKVVIPCTRESAEMAFRAQRERSEPRTGAAIVFLNRPMRPQVSALHKTPPALAAAYRHFDGVRLNGPGHVCRYL